jgi:hypothetical protein
MVLLTALYPGEKPPIRIEQKADWAPEPVSTLRIREKYVVTVLSKIE